MRYLLLSVIVLFSSNYILSQNKIFGFIKANGEPAVGCLVALQNGVSAMSDSKGFFELPNLANGTHQVVFSYIGYENVEKQVIIYNNNVELFIEFDKQINLNEVWVSAVRAKSQNPSTFQNLAEKDIEAQNTGQDVPYLLKWTPSLVETSDAGAGIGYTGMRIRGSDLSRINVTINGIPINDAESQTVYWVDLPDFATSTDAIQIQRGVGTSTNGAGAFGASINLEANKIAAKPAVQISSQVGSFRSLKNNVTINSGLLADKFSFNARLSKLQSNGYIDRASSDLTSYYISGAYIGKQSVLQLNTFGGHEKTYQAWYGIDLATLKQQRTYNPAGLKADGTFYENQVDDYTQTHYQALFSHYFRPELKANISLHYTRGKGFYEEYRIADELSKYHISDVTVGDTVFSTSNLIRRRWLDNHFYGIVYGLAWERNNWQTTLGGAINQYKGLHFGEVVWAALAPQTETGHRYYENDAVKDDANFFIKSNCEFSERWSAYLDLQVRRVAYEFQGFDGNGNLGSQRATHFFFNPKAGISFDMNNNNHIYTYFGVANREPNRNDYVESSINSRPQPETLYNVEMGYRHQQKRYQMNANLFYMYYKNQLALTGRINDVGEYTRQNLPVSHRLGVEADFSWDITEQFAIKSNVTLSDHRVQKWTEYVDDWDTGEQVAVAHANTNLAFAPQFIGNLTLEYDVFAKTHFAAKNELSISLSNKYISKQFLDNTSDEVASLKAYTYSDLKIQYVLKQKLMKELRSYVSIQNVFNYLYENNGWSYHYQTAGQRDYLLGFYPQAGRQYYVGMVFIW